MPNAAALAAEYVPVRQRPFAVTLTIVCVPLGAMLAGLIAERFLPTLGWRGLFGIGGAVPMVAAAAFFVLMPESPRFLVRFQARWGDLERTLRRMGRPVAPGSRFMESAGTSGDGSTGAPAVRGGSFGALFSRELSDGHARALGIVLLLADRRVSRVQLVAVDADRRRPWPVGEHGHHRLQSRRRRRRGRSADEASRVSDRARRFC